MRIALIAAVAQNGIIGRDNELPWRLPDEFRHFKDTTAGHHVIMGRKTWESRAVPLPRRINMVVTSQRDYSAPGAIVVGSLAEALRVAEEAGDDEAFVIGGTLLYAEALPLADRLYLTRIHASFHGDAVFPWFDESLWREVDRRDHPVDERHAHAYSIRVLDRIR